MSVEMIDPWLKHRRVFGVMGTILAAYGVALGVYAGTWVPVAGMTLFALIFVTVFGMDYPYAAMSEVGVSFRFVLVNRFVPWSEFRQAGICLFENKKATGIVHKSYRLGLLLPGGVPKTPGRRISYYKNMGRIIYLPDTPEIRAFVIAHYGLLDFDESVDPRGYSIVVD